jgi:hypothetical protein
LREGAKATGTILAADRVPLGTPALEAQGFSRWHLRAHVVPASLDARPYDAEMTLSLTSPDKVQKMASVGAVVPIRYDSADPQSFVIDSVAMGYPDPYAAALAAYAAAAGTKAS